MSTFTYPWDLADIGVDKALTRMSSDGFGALELMSCYHPITLYTPGATGRRLTNMDRGGVFFPARPERYGQIKPHMPDDSDLLSVWPRVAERAAQYGLTLNSWTVALYQPWIAFDHPDCARVTPEGYLNQSGVCPTSPAVREFIATLVSDLASQFDLKTVQLEGVTHPYVDTGMRLPRILVDWTPWIRWLASLCFCVNCTLEAKDRGIDVDRLQGRVVAELREHYLVGSGDRRKLSIVDSERRETDPDYSGFVAMREDVCVELVLNVARELSRVSPGTGLGIWAPEEFDGTRIDLERVLPTLSVLQTRQPQKALENARAARRIADDNGLRVTAVTWCGGRIGPAWGSEFEDALRQCVVERMDQIQLFNWAMLSPSITAEIVPTLRRIETELQAVTPNP